MSSLPHDMPSNWLSQIQKATKQSWLRTVVAAVISSSVMAGVIGFVGDSYRDQKTAEREAQKLLQKETIDQYGELGKKVQELHIALDNAEVTFQFFLDHNDRSLLTEIDKAKINIGRQIVGVNHALSAPRITDNDLKAKVRALFAELPYALEATQKDKRAVSKVLKLYNDKLEQDIEDVKNQIESIRASVPLVPPLTKP
jgi:signal transduction histidine kinase